MISTPTYNSQTPHWDKKCDIIEQKMGSSLQTDFCHKSINQFDEVDNPKKSKLTLCINEKESELFGAMKHEINRLNSFAGKWPLTYIKPTDLSECGFFYLQTEDKVQCTFCYLILNDWNVGDTPLREHIKNSPKCPFLLNANVGNEPMSGPRSSKVQERNMRVEEIRYMRSISAKPKFPRMSEKKNRMMTFNSWPLIMLSPRQLVECGLYYTGVADVVTCFFCGGSLGNWELDDDPWTEHKNFFPDCHYLAIAEKLGKGSAKKKPMSSSNAQQAKPQGALTLPVSNPREQLSSEIIRQASDIFSPALVQEVVSKRKQGFTSLNELCEEILELGTRQTMPMSIVENNSNLVCSKPLKVLDDTTSSREPRDILLCKICMDNERGVVFQPCGHLVSCQKCSLQIFNCPLCRSPITSKVRTYLS